LEDFVGFLFELVAAEVAQFLGAGPCRVPITQADFGVRLYAEVIGGGDFGHMATLAFY
jgi:hypothetical protein